ncbi:unnamed protein product [Dibothriocephalus latus]|uniref:Uncharacterized protein n=1 Tax=Dibothriocephalus latus TaxID=60516 RepID=A0A3P6PS35_DIBLA|nr:unnamed protein product [Dibothriocephalus latus]
MGFVEAPEVDGPAIPETLSSDSDDSDDDGAGGSDEISGDAPKDETKRKGTKSKSEPKPKSEPKLIPAASTRPSLRRVVRYSWSNSLSRQPKPTSLYDAYFELFGVLFNLALWYSKHAAKVAASNQ